MKVKTADLIGPALDWAVALCVKEKLSQASLSFQIKEYGCLQRPHFGSWKPSSSWAQGGLIIEQEKISIETWNEDIPGIEWAASSEITVNQYCDGDSDHLSSFGSTPLVAAMRCYCCSKLGEEVEVPEELCK